MALSKTFPVGQVLTAADVNTHLAHHVPSVGDPYDTGWTLVTPVNPYFAFPGYPIRVRRVGLVVQLEGLVRNADTTALPLASTHMFTIPNGFRPEDTFITVVSGSSTNVAMGRLILTPSGFASFATLGTVANSVYWSCHATWLAGS